MAIDGIDLNLLVTLAALFEERSVTRAAKRLRVTQPAVSNALARLRKQIGDPLLVRTAAGMALTPRAESMVGPLGAALADLERAVATPAAFDAETSVASFILAASDYSETALLPSLLADLAVTAPNVSLRVRSALDMPSAALETGKVDVVLGPDFAVPSAGVFRQKLFEDDFVCVARRNHPIVGRSVSLEQFLAAKHVTVGFGRGKSALDEQLALRGLRRITTLRVPHFLVASLVVARTDLVATLPRRIAIAIAAPLELQILEHPVPSPGFVIVQAWHERTHKSATHQWFRARLARAFTS